MKLYELHEQVNDLDVTTEYFAFGTLRDPDVLKLITGKEHDLSQVAYLPGFEAVHVKGESFPALIPSEGSRIEGRLVNSFSEEDWERLDWYEDDLYTTKVMFVEMKDGTNVAAQVYAFHDPKRIEPIPDKEWSYDKWRKTKQPAWIKKIPGWMADFGSSEL